MNRPEIKKFVKNFLLIALCILFYFLILRWNNLMGGINGIFRICAPVVAGLVLAYIMNPMMKLYRKFCLSLLKHTGKTKEWCNEVAKGVSILLTFITFTCIIAGFLFVVIPELYFTVRDLTALVPGQFRRLQVWVTKLMDKSSLEGESLTDVESAIISVIDYVQNYLSNFLENGLMERVTQSLGFLTTGVINVFRALYNFLVGFVVSLYALGNRESFISQGKKMTYALFPTDKADVVIGFFRRTNEIFSGFLIGKIIDSLIIGVIAYICLSIMKMPYALLNSVIIGCTNIIPIFGPFVGAVPCILLVLLVRPIYALRMGIFILILQQVDGNIIGPRILGDTTGLPGFWVLLALIFCGGLWGFVGMVIGVPLFATFYYLVKQLLEWRLRKRDFPTETNEYLNVDYFNTEKNDFERTDSKKRSGVRKGGEDAFAFRGTKIQEIAKKIADHIRKKKQDNQMIK